MKAGTGVYAGKDGGGRARRGGKGRTRREDECETYKWISQRGGRLPSGYGVEFLFEGEVTTVGIAKVNFGVRVGSRSRVPRSLVRVQGSSMARARYEHDPVQVDPAPTRTIPEPPEPRVIKRSFRVVTMVTVVSTVEHGREGWRLRGGFSNLFRRRGRELRIATG